MTTAGMLSMSRVIMPPGHPATAAGSGQVNCTRGLQEPNPPAPFPEKEGGERVRLASFSPFLFREGGRGVRSRFVNSLLSGPGFKEVPAAGGRLELGRLRLL